MSEQDGSSESDETEQTPETSSTTGETAPEQSPDETDGTAERSATDGEMSASTDEESAAQDATDRVEAGIGVAEDATDETDTLDAAEDLLQYVESNDPATVADEIATLRFEVETLEDDIAEYEEDIEDLQARIKRKQADFENYKKRMKKRQEQEQERATEDLVTRLLDVRDNLQRALQQDEDTDIRDGVESTLKQFDRVLEQENVTSIEPEPGEDVDPERHEVLVRMDSEQPADTIAQVHRPGYEMAGKIIRAAQVAVSEGGE